MDTRRRFVAMLDIMGATHLTEKAPAALGEVLQSSRKLIQEYQFASNLVFQMYSDSITILTKNDDPESFEDIAMASAVIERMFVRKGYAINGAISYGDIFMDEGKDIIFYGNPVVSAHKIQENLFFYGIVLDKFAEEKYLAYSSMFSHGNANVDSADMIILDMMIPCKDSGWQKYSIVNWMDICVFKNDGLVTYDEQVPEIRHLMTQLYKKNVLASDHGKRASFYILNTELVLREWYDYAGKKNERSGWGDLLADKYLIYTE